MAQWVKNMVLSPLWLWLQLWLGFNSWPGSFHMQVWPGKKKKKRIGDQTLNLDCVVQNPAIPSQFHSLTV